jgi:putative hydrolase of the HAD superfamily
MTVKSTIRAIITDLDGVIRFFPVERDHEIESRYSLPHGTIAEAAFEPMLLQSVIKGEMSDVAWRSQILAKLQVRFSKYESEVALREWSDFSGHVDWDCLSLIKSLRLYGPLALLTNATDRLFLDLDALQIRESFDFIFNSSKIGLIKPDKALFLRVCSDLGVLPSEGLFIDDSISNVEAAVEVGLQAIHFNSLDRLRLDLGAIFQ